jgi:hypothetical protein
VSNGQLLLLLGVAGAVLVAILVLYRPLLFASVDPEARGVPVKAVGLAFLFVLAVTVTEAAQIVGALLVLSLAITPAAAAHRLSSRPAVVAGLSVLFALLASDGGLLVSLHRGQCTERPCERLHHRDQFRGVLDGPPARTPVGPAASGTGLAQLARRCGEQLDRAPRRAALLCPSGSSSPKSSNSTMPLHNKLHPCSGCAEITCAASRSEASVVGHAGVCRQVGRAGVSGIESVIILLSCNRFQ